MKAALKTTLWAVGVVAITAAIAAPKLLPLMQREAAARTAQTPAGEGRKTGAGGGQQKGEGGGAPMKVSAVRVAAAPFVETLNATGTLIAEEGVELQAETSGKVVAINFREGAKVRKGELLVKLNDAELRATLTRARHQLALAETRERRLGPLIKQGLVRQEDYDIAAAEVNVQKAEIELTEAQIAETEIRAPFDGVAGLRYVSEGAYVSAATRVATLQRLDKLKIDFSVPEKYATRIRVGAPVRFSVAGAKERFEGRIYAYDPRIDAGTRSLLIRAQTDNADRRLLPGAFANVELVLDSIDDALLVPAAAVIPGLNEKTVYVFNDGKAERRAVETGTRTESTVQILAGLAPGDIVITSGLQNMRPGQAIALDDGLMPPKAGAVGKPHGADALAATPGAPTP